MPKENVSLTLQQFCEITQYINTELFSIIPVFHPQYSKDGIITSEVLTILKSLNTEVVIAIDRNILSDILTAVKCGSFKKCRRRKAITAFLYWVGINEFNISPYEGIKEQAFVEFNNISGNKELELFNHFFDCIPPQAVISSFFSEDITFCSKKYCETSDSEEFDFLSNDADFMYLYASMLHLVYEIRVGKSRIEQFKNILHWYFQEELISQPGLTYIVLLFVKEGIKPPHHMMDNSRVIHGCKNAAMDLYYFQEIDPRRYPSDKYTFFAATNDGNMMEIFKNAYNPWRKQTPEELLKKLCQYCKDKNANDYSNILLEEFHLHNYDNSVGSATFHFKRASELCAQEEKRLVQLIKA